ncbi:hypothetical protein SAMN02910317_01097 [Ruminococcaceae bacterium FB2012]|nr:hypothetical protein SAMN02910317_01097 [Ruminococcaceae bacterium FB2012]
MKRRLLILAAVLAALLSLASCGPDNYVSLPVQGNFASAE